MVLTGSRALSRPHLGWRLGYRRHQSGLYQTDMLTGAPLMCLWIFLLEVWPFPADRETGRRGEGAAARWEITLWEPVKPNPATNPGRGHNGNALHCHPLPLHFPSVSVSG